MKLDEIKVKEPSDKCTRHNYGKRYDSHVGHLSNCSFNLLEIGVLLGGSLRAWKEYFPLASISAIDINPNCKSQEEERIKIHIGSQTDEKFLNQINQSDGPFTLIIDDGSHVWSDAISTFETLFPKLVPGGFYVIEDLHTSYNFKFSGIGKISTVEYLKSTIDSINCYGQYGEVNNRSASKRKEFIRHKKLDPIYQISGISFYPSICFIEKESKDALKLY